MRVGSESAMSMTIVRRHHNGGVASSKRKRLRPLYQNRTCLLSQHCVPSTYVLEYQVGSQSGDWGVATTWRACMNKKADSSRWSSFTTINHCEGTVRMYV